MYTNAMPSLKLIRIGNSVGAIFPKEVLARLQLREGDKIILTEAQDGYRMRPYDEEFERQMDAARSIMRKDRAILRELSK